MFPNILKGNISYIWGYYISMCIFKLTQLMILSDTPFLCLLPILTLKNRKVLPFLTVHPLQSIPLSNSNSFCFMLIIYCYLAHGSWILIHFYLRSSYQHWKRKIMRHLNFFPWKFTSSYMIVIPTVSWGE